MKITKEILEQISNDHHLYNKCAYNDDQTSSIHNSHEHVVLYMDTKLETTWIGACRGFKPKRNGSSVGCVG